MKGLETYLTTSYLVENTHVKDRMCFPLGKNIRTLTRENDGHLPYKQMVSYYLTLMSFGHIYLKKLLHIVLLLLW